jgi:hypothetical protein
VTRRVCQGNEEMEEGEEEKENWVVMSEKKSLSRKRRNGEWV